MLANCDNVYLWKPISIGFKIWVHKHTIWAKHFWRDEQVATVDENGVVTAVSAGTATITIVTENELTTTLTVTVKDAPIANPNTLDNVVVYGAIMMIALAGLASSAILIKKNAE